MAVERPTGCGKSAILAKQQKNSCYYKYKTFANVLQIRTVSAEYRVAMKLMAGRQYKNDLSDIVGVLIEQEERNEPLTFEKIQKVIILLIF